MHFVTIPKAIDMGNLGLFPAGRLIMEDKNAAEMMLQWPEAGISLEPYDHKIGHIDPTKILVAGGIGMGDAIMLTPVLRALKVKYPLATVEVACFPHYRAPLLNLPYVDGFADWPLPAGGPWHHHYTYFLENYLSHPLARTEHLSDVFAAICGVELTDKHADYLPTAEERDWAVATFPRNPARKRIGMQVQASHRCRTYPTDLFRDVMGLLVRDGWEVYMMGTAAEYGCVEMGHIHDLRKDAPSFRESAAFLLTCDAFFGPDSGFLHVAGAMGVPAVGVFGAFPWKLRTAYYPSVFAIQGAGECSPCFHTPTRLQPAFPLRGPCAKTMRCDVLASIEPERIKAKIDQIAR
jgi:ADP-heptose:LPS heptosyltransferase